VFLSEFLIKKKVKNIFDCKFFSIVKGQYYKLFKNNKFILKSFIKKNIYIGSYGFIKLKLVRIKEAKGVLRFRSFGTKHHMNFKKNLHALATFRSSLRYKFSPTFLIKINLFFKNVRNCLFSYFQKNLNLALNFFENKKIIETFYFQLYYYFQSIFIFYKTSLYKSKTSVKYSKSKKKMIYVFLLKFSLYSKKFLKHKFLFYEKKTKIFF